MRKDMQMELKEMHKTLGITFVYVTHDQEEALTLSDTIVVMSEGRIQQIGTPVDIYNEPINSFVADFIGESNILNGIMIKDKLVRFAGVEFECVDEGFRVFSKVRENIELAKKANLPINIALTLSHHMLPYFKETIEYIYSTNLNCGMSPFPHQANENTGRNFNTYNVSLEEAISCIEQKLELEYKKNGDLLKKTANYKDGDIKKGLLCGAGICSCCIGWDGYMHACANYRGLGYNAVEIGVKKAWKMLSKTVSSYEIPGQCCKCELFKEKHCTFCPIEHGCKFGEKFKVNNEICSRRKKIYSKFNLEKNK